MELLVVLTLVGLGALAQEFEPLEAPIELDYHNKLGIPLAARIKAAEEALDFDGARIVGGSPSGIGAYPYLGGLVITLHTDAISVCGSSLLSNTRAVTAARCWQSVGGQAHELTVVLGSTLLFSGGTRVTTRDVVVHEGYNMWTLVNDIAIIRMRWVNYGPVIHNILPYSGPNMFAGYWAWTAGFGRTSDSSEISTDQYQSHVAVQIITNAACQFVYGPTTVQDTTLCTAADGRGTCGGDYGGPLITNCRLVGITSFEHRDGCQLGYPAGFTRVSSFAAWIEARMGTSI